MPAGPAISPKPAAPRARAGQSLQRQEREQAKADKKRIKELERELKRKDKALAEAAAILVLRKKFNAYWSDDSEES